MIPRSVVVDLDLARYGLRTMNTDPYATYLGPDGESIAQWRDLARTKREIARFSRRDAERYERFALLLGDAWNAFLPYLQGHPKRIAPGDVVEMARRAVKARKSLAPAMRILLSSPAQVLEEWFERDELKVILGTWAAATGQVSLDTPGSAAGMAMAVLSHRWGCHRAVGGMGAVSDALAACVLAHGGEIRTGVPVARIVVEGNRAVGVELADTGEMIRAGDVVAALDPSTLFSRLIDPEILPDEVRDELRGMTISDANITYFTGHAALAKRPSLARYGRDEELLRAGYQMLVPTYDSLKRALSDAQAGIVPAEIPIWASFPSVVDRSLVPAGTDTETLYVMTPVTPYELADNQDWDSYKQTFLDQVIDTVDSYAPGLKSSIVGTAAVSPVDMSKWTTKGHACHIDMSLSQLGPWRPTPSLSGYATPVDSLWQVSAGSHALPSVNGWAGRTGARTLLAARTRRGLPGAARRAERQTAGVGVRPPEPATLPSAPLR
jgi:beta-carotene ketolase (CrtO type)